MKVLHVLSSPSFSGAENVACQIISMFKDTDKKMVYTSPFGPVSKALEKRNIPYIPMSEFSVRELRKVIKEFKPDIIHAHDMHASFITSLVCNRIPYISHIHNNNFNSRGISIKSIAYLLAALKAKHIIWVSQSSFNGYFFSKLLKKKSTVLYNVINIGELKSRSLTTQKVDKFDAIFLGRLTYQKNPLRLIDIFKLSIEKNNSLRFGIIGDGDMKEEVKKKVQDLDLQKNIEFVGYSENPMPVVRNAKVMVMSSLWEGTPMCALESLGLGTPIVSTPVDGLNDIIKDGYNGFLSDSNHDLANKICEIASNQQLYQQLSYNAIEEATRINDISNYRNIILETYTKAIEE